MSPPESISTYQAEAAPAERFISWMEWAVSFGLLAACIFLNWTFLRHAGGYWRDEANSVQLASWPGVAENWRLVWLDAHPVGYALLLKPFLAGGLDNVEWLRWLGFGMAVLTFGTFWGIAFDLTRRPPTAIFALFALNHYAVRFIGSIRPYGFATWLLLLLFWRWYRVTVRSGEDKPVRIPWDCLVLGAVVVNFLYASAVLVAVLGLGASAMIWRRQGSQAGMKCLCACVFGLAPLALYLPALAHARYWADLQSYRYPAIEHFQGAFLEVIETQNTPLRWVWLALICASIPAAAALILRGGSARREAGAFWCLGTACLAGVVGLLYFGKTFTAPWYFMPALALFALSTQVALGTAATKPAARLGAAITALLLAGMTLPQSVPLLELRQTNMDLLASRLNREARPGDLVIVTNPLQGVAFNLYYRGAAPWNTIPPLPDHRIHRFDLIREEAGKTGIMPPLLRQVEQVLRNGGTLYLVGGVKYVEAKPDPSRNFDFDVPLANWTNELAVVLGQHVQEAKTYQVEGNLPVMPTEHPPLIVVRGWR